MKKRNKTFKIRCFWWQNWGIFYPITFVVVGYDTPEELIKAMKKHKMDKEAPDWYRAIRLKYQDDARELDGNHHFSSWKIENVKTGKDVLYSILFLRHWKNDEEHRKILMHELIHAVSFVLPDFIDTYKENEAFAYTHGYLYEKITDKLKKLL